jgi:hypothetical protein
MAEVTRHPGCVRLARLPMHIAFTPVAISPKVSAQPKSKICHTRPSPHFGTIDLFQNAAGPSAERTFSLLKRENDAQPTRRLVPRLQSENGLALVLAE